MTPRALNVGLLLALSAAPAGAQSLSTELDATLGYSTQGVTGAAGQLRTFGELKPGLRIYLEAAGASHSGPESDAFSAAYWYSGSPRLNEAYLEGALNRSGMVAGLRAGRYRTPFGIHDRSDFAYDGFLRPPLVRWGYCMGLSNYWLEGGLDAYVGKPQLQLEASLGAPQEGLKARRGGLDTVVRLQSQHGSLIAGASYMKTQAFPAKSFIRGRAEYAGMDARWMRNGLQLRAEWMAGHPFDRAHMSGWYADALLHRRFLGHVTPVARYEQYRFRAPGHAVTWKRLTVGARIQIAPAWIANVNLVHNPYLEQDGGNAVDLGITHTMRY